MSDQIICFYNIGDENEFLSNWYVSPFELDGIRFFCIEQYMMYRKAAVFHDEEAMAAILASDDQGEIKALGRGVKNYDGTTWEGLRQAVVFRGMLAKFSQNPKLLDLLRATGDAVLVECSPTDQIWGVGLLLDDERRYDPLQWQGQNLCGYTLMEVREQLTKNDM
ncbi:MAG: NADAR family protein [Lachnospiraceae bacterium]|nr:NADAR family protein [Lachnospiraceae bacterium]